MVANHHRAKVFHRLSPPLLLRQLTSLDFEGVACCESIYESLAVSGDGCLRRGFHRACRRVGWQIDDAGMLVRQAHLTFRAEHAVGSNTADRGSLQQQLREADDTHRALVLAQQTLLNAAQELSVATGNILGATQRAGHPEASIAVEMSSLAAALNRLPCKSMVRTLLRLLVRLLGRP